MLTAEQIELRQRGIGGSEQGVLAGVSNRMMATELYYRKRGEWVDPDPDDTFFADMGHAAEQPMAAWFERETGEQLYRQRKTKFHRDPALGFLLGHSDRRIRGQRRGVEFKMRVSYSGWGYGGTDDVPHDVRLQCQQYMTLFRADAWHVAAFLGGRDRRRYLVGHDQGLEDQIIERSLDFWARVRLGNPPPIDPEHPTAVQFLHELYPGADGRQVTLSADFAHWLEVHEDAKGRIKALEDARRTARAVVEDAMGSASVGMLADGSHTVVRKLVKPSSPDRSTYLTFNIKRNPR